MNLSISEMTSILHTVWDNLTTLISVKVIVTVSATLFSYLFGIGNASLILGLLVMVFIDLILWVTSCHSRKCPITWEGSLQHPLRFFVYCLMIIAAHMAETTLPVSIGMEQAMVIFVTFSEFIAIMKTLGDMGYNIPQRLLNLADQTQQLYGSDSADSSK